MAPSDTLAPRIDERSGFRCEALLRVEPSIVAAGGTFKIVCEARCTGEALHVYNGFLSERFKLPAQIVITSADGQICHEILRPPDGPISKSDERCWVLVQNDQTIGRELWLRIGDETAHPTGSPIPRTIKLAPGHYTVQAIYNYWLVADWQNRPGRTGTQQLNDIGDEPQPWWWAKAMNMQEPMAVSEPVKLVVNGDLPRAIERPAQSAMKLRLELDAPKIIETAYRTEAETRTRITNHSDETLYVYDPFLDPRLSFQKAVELAVLKDDGESGPKYLGNYLGTESGHTRTLRKTDWVRFSPGGTVSTLIRFWPRNIPLNQHLGGEVAPGKYLLELRGHEALLSPPGALIDTDDVGKIATDQGYAAWRRGFPGPIIVRSNRIELEIPSRTGECSE
jgi:hypothetical protein